VINALGSAIYSALQGTAITSLLSGTTAIYHMQAPEGAAYPYVVFSWQGGGDENLDPHRTKNGLIFVRGYSKSGAANAGSIDAQIDTKFHLSPLTLTGWSNLWLARETDLETVETTPAGELVWMAGGFYRIRLEKS
jgi:hypothetical protein